MSQQTNIAGSPLYSARMTVPVVQKARTSAGLEARREVWRSLHASGAAFDAEVGRDAQCAGYPQFAVTAQSTVGNRQASHQRARRIGFRGNVLTGGARETFDGACRRAAER